MLATTLALAWVLGSPCPTPLAAVPQIGEGVVTDSSAGALPPASVVRQVRSARIAEERGDVAEAIAALRRTIEEHPDSLVAVEALLALARRGGLGEAEQSALLDTFGQRLDAPGRRVSTAVLTYLVHSPDSDEETLRRIADRLEAEIPSASVGGDFAGTEDDLGRLELLVDVRQRLGDAAGSLATLEVLYAASGWERLLWPLYLQNAQAENWGRAAEVVERLVAAGSEGLRSTWVELLARAGDTDGLLEQLSILESEGWSDVSSATLANLAWHLVDAGERDAAEPLFRRAMTYPDADPQLRTARLHLYGSESDRLAQAAEDDQKWRAEDDPQTLFDEGTQRLTVGDAEGAIDLLERAAEGLPEVEAAWYNLGLAAYRLERWETAAKAFGSATRLNGRRAQNHLYLGIALVELGRCGEAVGALENAVGMDSSQSLAHYHLSSCYRSLGEEQAAAAAWARYQELRSQD